MLKQACQLLDEHEPNQRVAVVAKEGWHSGVAALWPRQDYVELYQRPSAVILFGKWGSDGFCQGHSRREYL